SVLGVFQPDPDTGSISISRSIFPAAVGLAQFGFGIFIGPFLLAIVGGWLGGEGDPRDIRQAVAWSYLPYVVGNIPVTAALLFGGVSVFDPTGGGSIPVLLLILGLVAWVVTIWSFVLLIAGIAEVQRISIWRALASVCILMIPVLMLGLLSRLHS